MCMVSHGLVLVQSLDTDSIGVYALPLYEVGQRELRDWNKLMVEEEEHFILGREVG